MSADYCECEKRLEKDYREQEEDEQLPLIHHTQTLIYSFCDDPIVDSYSAQYAKINNVSDL